MVTKNDVGIEMMRLSSKLGAIQLNPFMNKYDKQDKILSTICQLSEDTFMQAVPIFMKDYNIFGDKQFKNSEKQLESILERYPRLKYYKGIVDERVRVGRKKAKLEI